MISLLNSFLYTYGSVIIAGGFGYIISDNLNNNLTIKCVQNKSEIANQILLGK